MACIRPPEDRAIGFYAIQLYPASSPYFATAKTVNRGLVQQNSPKYSTKYSWHQARMKICNQVLVFCSEQKMFEVLQSLNYHTVTFLPDRKSVGRSQIARSSARSHKRALSARLGEVLQFCDVARGDAPGYFVAVPRPGLRICSVWAAGCSVGPGIRDDC
jgi:hypothetical protein